MSGSRRRRKPEVEWRDGQRSNEHTHIGRVTVFRRGRTWNLRYREGGVERRVRIGQDKKLAEQHAAEVNAQLTCGIRSTFQFEKIGVDDLVGRWLEHHELVKQSSMRTINRYRTAIAHLARYARERRPSLMIDTLTVPVAEEFVKFLRTVKISPNGCDRTKKRHMRDRGVLSVLRTCRALWNFAFQHRHVPPYSTNPFTDIEIESMCIDDMKPRYILTEAEEATFLEAWPPWEFRVFFTLAFTGMRPGELIHLLVDDVSLETRTVSIRNHHELGWRTKTRGERRVYLEPAEAHCCQPEVRRGRGPAGALAPGRRSTASLSADRQARARPQHAGASRCVPGTYAWTTSPPAGSPRRGSWPRPPTRPARTQSSAGRGARSSHLPYRDRIWTMRRRRPGSVES